MKVREELEMKDDFVEQIIAQLAKQVDDWDQYYEAQIRSFIGEIYDAYVNKTEVKLTDENKEFYYKDF